MTKEQFEQAVDDINSAIDSNFGYALSKLINEKEYYIERDINQAIADAKYEIESILEDLIDKNC